MPKRELKLAGNYFFKGIVIFQILMRRWLESDVVM